MIIIRQCLRIGFAPLPSVRQGMRLWIFFDSNEGTRSEGSRFPCD